MSRANMSLESCNTAATVSGGTVGKHLSARWADRAVKLLWRIVSWPGHMLDAREAMSRLGNMSDHELKDIGLSRQDLRDATSLVPDDDPTRMLAARAVERRRSMG